MKVLVAQSSLTLCDPMDFSPPGSSVHGDSPGKNIGVLPCPPPGDLSNPGIGPRSHALQVDSLPSEPPGKTMEVVKVKVVQSCLTLCDPMDYTVYGILQARILE